MKLADIVKQFQVLLPKYTDEFSTSANVSSIIASGGTATITTSVAHGIKTGNSVTLANVNILTSIDSVSKDGLQYTFTTSTSHDLTENWPDFENVTLGGFTDSDWNSSFKLLRVPNRQTFVVQSANSLPILNGNEVLHDSSTINGQYSATTTSSNAFTISGDFSDGTYTDGTVGGFVRAAAAVNIERAIQSYTENNINQPWLFVTMHDADVSKDRSDDSDATATRPTGVDIRQRLVDGFSVHVVVNTSNQIAGELAVDICRHDLLLPILKSVYGARFDTGLSGGADFKAVFLGHGTEQYDKRIYVHVYDFEVSMELTNGDTVEPSYTRAFRDIDYTQTIGVEDMTININLDDTPL